MKSTRTIRNMLLMTGVIATASFAMPAFATDSNMMPQPVHQGNVTYITGGIGDGERNALRTDARGYNLLVTDANTKGQYTVDTDFTITSKNGREVISVRDAGPLFFAKLAPGEYIVKASSDGQERVRDVKVSAKKPADIHLIWHES